MRTAPVACALAAVLALGACGEPSTEEQVRDTMQRFSQALADKDYQELCEQLLSRELLSSIEGAGIPCGVALLRGLEDVQRPTLRILRVNVRSERLALVEARTDAANQEPLPTTFRVVREGEAWKVAQLSGAQPPAPPPARP